MGVEKISFDRLKPSQPPVVVMGDLTLIRTIAAAQVPIVLATSEEDDIALHSRYLSGSRVVSAFVQQPGLDRCAEELVDLGTRLSRHLGRKVPLFYNSDKHLEVIYRHRKALSDVYLMLLNDEDVAWALHDKSRFGPLCEKAGVRVPKTLQTSEDIERGLDQLREPVLVKPKQKNSWLQIKRELFDGQGKARVFATKKELLAHPAFARFKDEVIVQEYIGGSVANLVSFHGLADENGQLLASYCGRKIRTYPDFAGESCFIELLHDPKVEAEGRDIARRLGLKGPFKVDLIQDERSGLLYTLEINARFNLWNQLGAANGVNFCGLAYDYLVHGRRPLREPDYSDRYRWVNFYRDYLTFKDQRRRGELGLRSWLGSLTGPHVLHETFKWDDPVPFALWVGNFIKHKFV